MKIISIIKRSALALVALFAFAGCNEPDPDSVSVVDPTTDSAITMIYADTQGGEFYYKVLTDSWSVVSSDSDWCIPQKGAGYEYGETSSVYVKAFTGDEDSRTATLTFKSGVATHTVMVSQSKRDDMIDIYPSSGTIDYKAQTLSFVVNSNFEWNVVSSVAWADVSVNDDNKTVSISVEENMSASTPREAIITIQAHNDENGAISTTSTTYTLTQEARNDLYLTPTTPRYTFTADAGETTIDLFTNIFKPAYTVSAASDSNDEWCSATYSEESGLVITAKKNVFAEARTATVTIIARSESGAGNDTVTATIEVTQEGCADPVLNLGQSTAVYDQKGGEFEIKYYTNCVNATATSNCDWITDVNESSERITFTLTENMNGSTRKGEITISVSQGGKTLQGTITIYQNGIGELDLQITPDFISVDEKGETGIALALLTNSVASDLKFEWVSPTADWATLNKDTTDTSKATVDVSANDTMYERECYIVVKLSAGDQTVVKSVTVLQKGKSLEPGFSTEDTTTDAHL